MTSNQKFALLLTSIVLLVVSLMFVAIWNKVNEPKYSYGEMVITREPKKSKPRVIAPIDQAQAIVDELNRRNRLKPREYKEEEVSYLGLYIFLGAVAVIAGPTILYFAVKEHKNKRKKGV